MSTLDPKDLLQIHDGGYMLSTGTIENGNLTIRNDPYANIINVGGVKLTKEYLEDLISIKEFLDSLPPKDSELGRLWLAYKAKKRITE